MTSFQKLFGISLLIIALSIAYYLIVFVPNRDKTKQTLEIQREASISSCLGVALNTYTSNWNYSCKQRGLGDSCLLPQNQANEIDTALKLTQDNCYKLYPPQ